MGIWLRRFACLALLGFPLSVLGTRLGLFDFRIGFQGLRYTVYLSIAVLVIGVFVALIRRRSNPNDARAAKMAALLCILPIAGIGSQLYVARSLPAIHNISTDTVDPPAFAMVAQLRTEHHNPLDYDSGTLAAVQRQAYPQVKTMHTHLSQEEAHSRALAVVEAMGWELVAQNKISGIIEATETTLLWGFKDDVVVRVREQDNQVAVDLRSVSRVGKSDLGANAKRIEKFLQEFNK